MSDTEKTTSPYLVLVANDQEWEGRSLESILGPHGFAVVHAHTGRQTLDLARRTRPDAIIVDVGMPDIDGMEVCRRLRGEGQITAGTPVVVTTAGPAGRAQKLAAYKAGAWEFLGHPMDSEALLLKLRNFVEAKRESDRYREICLLDQASGLYNVRGLSRRAQEIGADASRRHVPLACVAVAALADGASPADLDAMEASVTEYVGETFRRTARNSDVLGLLGHAEFGVIAPETEAQGALRLLERLQAAMESAPLSIEGTPRPLRVKAGYYAVPDYAQSSVDAVEMLMRAAAALRKAKAADPAASVVAFEDLPAREAH